MVRLRHVILPTVVALVFSVPVLSRVEANSSEFRSLLERGFQFHRHRQYAEALPLLKRAWQLEPKDHDVNLLLGIDLLHTGDRAEAVSFLQEASRLEPNDEFAYEYLGEAEAGLNRYAEAAMAYGSAVRAAPQSPQAAIAFVDFSLERFRRLAQQLRTSRDGLAAEFRLQAMAHPLADASREKLLERAAALDGNAPGIWSELALCQIARNERSEALQDLARAKVKNPADLRAWQAEALLAAEAGDWPVAEKKLNAIARRSPAMLAQAAADWPRNLHPAAVPTSGASAGFFQCLEQHTSGACNPATLRQRFGRFEKRSTAPPHVLFDQQRWESLAALTAPAVRQKQQWYFRGVALAHMSDCVSAIPSLERGLGMQPEPVHGLFLLSWCYARRAGDIANQIERTSADPALLHVLRGDVLFRLQGNSEKAISEYRSALAAHPHDLRVLERLAEAQLSAGHEQEARKSAQTVLEVDPRLVSAKRVLIKIAMQERNYKAALPYLREIVAANPADLSARVELGTACAKTGSLEEALHNLTLALQHGYPDEKGTLHYLLGTVLRRLGRTGDADREFDTARKLSNASERRSREGGNALP